MKRYVPIIIGFVALCVLLYAGNGMLKKRESASREEDTSSILLGNFQGKVTKMYEGENMLEYGFSLPENATTTVEKDGSLVKVTEEGKSVLAMYVSFEGGRGYTPSEYVANVIAKSIPALTVVGTTTMGGTEWMVAESKWSTWHVAPAATGTWLLVVENKKADAEKANTIIETISTR